jgi:CHRD domain
MKSISARKVSFLAIIAILTLNACSKDEAIDEDDVVLIKHWDIALNAKLENPAPAGRTETGTASLDLYSDNSMDYHIMLNTLAAGDALTASHIHFGDPVTNGPVILNFNPTFAGTMATGKVTGIRSSLIDTILNNTVYVNVHSAQVGSGLARGQIDKTIDYALDVPLSGDNEVPAVTTTATGLALLRLATDKTLYSKITVSDLEADDELTQAHIHAAAAGVNGPVIQGLAASKADFGVSKDYTLTDAVYNSLKNDPVYVNAHSVKHGSGLVRGQIR